MLLSYQFLPPPQTSRSWPKYRFLMEGTAENQDPFWSSSISLPRLAPMSAKWQFVKMKKDIIDLELLLDKDLEKFDWVCRLINIYIIFFSQKISVQTELDLAGWPWKSITQNIIQVEFKLNKKRYSS